MQSPRIAFAHGSNDLYGASRVLLQDVEGLIALGCVVDVLLPEEGPLTALLRDAGASVAIKPLRVLRKVAHPTELRPPLTLPAELKRADIVVVWTLALASYLPVLRLHRKRTVLSVHEILDGSSGRVLIRGASMLSDVQMANSQTTRQWMVDQGCAPSSIVVAYPARPDYDPLPPVSPTPGRLDVLLAGRVNGHKGHHEAVVAGRIVRENGIDLRLQLLGGSFPGQERYLESLLAEIADEPWVTFSGEVSDIRPYLANAQAMLVPTTRPEPFGVVALEAWAAGRRVIASNEGGLAEATRLVDGVAFVPRDVHDLAAAIERVARSTELQVGPSADAEVSTACTTQARQTAWFDLFELLPPRRSRRHPGRR
ncbi:MAG: glycosyltransferase family 4 protein [Solirubrobacteraceae bacterium]|nr:glycosyltransferase family 4 protein [Solirubrobacteraceae bacterium]